jgi:hypothetical protein
MSIKPANPQETIPFMDIHYIQFLCQNSKVNITFTDLPLMHPVIIYCFCKKLGDTSKKIIFGI